MEGVGRPCSNMAEREDLVFRASLAEQTERYSEMARAMTEVVRLDGELTANERHMLSVAHKNVVGAKRAAWRVLCSIEARELEKAAEDASRKTKMTREYKAKVEEELRQVCWDVLSSLTDCLIPSATTGDAKVFFYKMQGDYYRYLAEFETNPAKKEAADQSLASYEASWNIAITELPPTNATRLGLALNFSVFYYEIMEAPHKACDMAKQAFDDAVVDLESVSGESYKDATLIMQLLRDNLTLWTSELQCQQATAEEADK